MTFIITLISLVIERFFHWGQLRDWRWLAKYQRWLSVRKVSNWPSWLMLLICVAPPVLVVGLVNVALSNWLFGIPKLLFGVVVFMYCLGPKNFWVQVYSCMAELNKEDVNAAHEKINAAFNLSATENAQAFHYAFVRAIFAAAFNRVFAVLFWFVVLGPVGAVLYRTLSQLSLDSPLGLSPMAEKWVRILDWIPDRLFTFIFALCGHFTHVFVVWRRYALSGVNMNETLLMECGIAALDVVKENQIPETGEAEKEAVGLLDRVFVVSLVILAVIVLLV